MLLAKISSNGAVLIGSSRNHDSIFCQLPVLRRNLGQAEFSRRWWYLYGTSCDDETVINTNYRLFYYVWCTIGCRTRPVDLEHTFQDSLNEIETKSKQVDFPIIHEARCTLVCNLLNKFSRYIQGLGFISRNILPYTLLRKQNI